MDNNKNKFFKSEEIISKQNIIVIIGVILIYFVVSQVVYYYSGVDISDEKRIIKAVIKRDKRSDTDIDDVHIIKIKYNKDEYFVLYQYYEGPYRLAIFEENDCKIEKRYRYIGGSGCGRGPVAAFRYGTYNTGQGTPWNQCEVLKVVYGDNSYINADYFTLTFVSGATIKQEIKDESFLYIYRFYSKECDTGDLKFYDESGERIRTR
ncbi:hypothetical protein [Oceanirhabdus sp. W0125-5]|uniref:hypothetical protein n=1 Tax=Oceanirhabdus sp. W0125-5 TaxID=2999116 RepID=UPI0022F2A77F|nr:hypothetical protein [Oceanirhabdus sp. W0125-5]WBW98902.1 hypothetical protein OW730_09210 [Oceanirhabdus sp. W0125-5]